MIPIPKLDTTSFKEIYENMRKTANSTDYADPKDALIELFALLIDMQRFYTDQIMTEHIAKYLKLLGHNSQEGLLADMKKIYRASTLADYEALVMDMENTQIAKAVLRDGNTIEIYVKNFSENIREYLEPYRIIAINLVVIKAEPLPFSISCGVDFTGAFNENASQVKDTVEEYFKNFPIGKRVVYGDIYRIIDTHASVKGVKYLNIEDIQPTFAQYAQLINIDIC